VSYSARAVIAVASGKGGTGKTTVAAHLALASAHGRKTLLVDLDAEAPDALGYFSSAIALGAPLSVQVAVPRFHEELCTGCRRCAQSCRFGAIVAIGKSVTINEQICKGCGRCVAGCPTAALSEVESEVGKTTHYRDDALDIIEGRMTVGDIRSTAVIEATKRRAVGNDALVQIRDCPPGVSCPATHAIEGADYVVLVAEPTEFSLHDLGAAIELVQGRGIPAGRYCQSLWIGNLNDFSVMPPLHQPVLHSRT
jgi:MinD superfamily P-loop ATPase